MTQEDASQGADGVQIPKEGTLTYDGRYRRYSFYGIIFEVPVRYVPLVPIGRGAYGIVCSARDETTGEEVAIKKIGKAFNDRTDAKRTLREIVLLRNMNHPNVIAIKDIIRPPNPQSFQDVYIVYELMPTDLHEVIRSGQAMDERHYKDVYIVYELMPTDLHEVIRSGQAMDERHYKVRGVSGRVQGLAVQGVWHYRVSGCHNKAGAWEALQWMTSASIPPVRACIPSLHEVIQYYRAPELLVNNQQYSASIDVWSVALIYLELVLGHIVLKGDNYVDQLRKTCELIGYPSAEDASFIVNDAARTFLLSELQGFPARSIRDVFPKLSELGALIGSPSAEDASFIVNDAARTFLLSELQGFPARSIRDVFPKLSEPAADLVQRMLVFDPRKRITVPVHGSPDELLLLLRLSPSLPSLPHTFYCIGRDTGTTIGALPHGQPAPPSLFNSPMFTPSDLSLPFSPVCPCLCSLPSSSVFTLSYLGFPSPPFAHASFPTTVDEALTHPYLAHYHRGRLTTTGGGSLPHGQPAPAAFPHLPPSSPIFPLPVPQPQWRRHWPTRTWRTTTRPTRAFLTTPNPLNFPLFACISPPYSGRGIDAPLPGILPTKTHPSSPSPPRSPIPPQPFLLQQWTRHLAHYHKSNQDPPHLNAHCPLSDTSLPFLCLPIPSPPTVDEALAHPYLAHYHKANQDPPHPNPFQFDLSFEQEEYDIPRIRQLIFEQACAFNPQ
ncbi:unnamed protein product [Closterium sp. Naga37s-1]|nr:unnamed protein product [Closterium sp. Naga37s-1]